LKKGSSSDRPKEWSRKRHPVGGSDPSEVAKAKEGRKEKTERDGEEGRKVTCRFLRQQKPELVSRGSLVAKALFAS
jgi:hypothetical protein